MGTTAGNVSRAMSKGENIMLRKHLLSWIGLLGVVGISVVQAADAPWQTPADVEFKARLDGSPQRYVLMLPKCLAAATPVDLVVALHGHGSDRWQFVQNDRDECRAMRDAAARYGMIFVSPDYRAKTSWMGPKAEADVLQILDEIGSKVPIRHVFVFGGSMGASSALTFAALHPDRVSGVVALNGTANHVEYQGFQQAIAESFGGAKAAVPEEYRRRSAELCAERLTMPMAATVGGRDKLVPPGSVRRLFQKLKDQGRPVVLIDRPDGGHSTDYADTMAAVDFVVDKVRGAALPCTAMGLVPRPVQMSRAEGQFMLDAATVIVGSGLAAEEAKALAEQLSSALGRRPSVRDASDASEGAIHLVIEPGAADEGYRLVITPRRIEIRAATAAGLFYGGQTLRQLLPPAACQPQANRSARWSIPCVSITDSPRFAWRGLVLDPARHFMPPDYLKKLVEVMALHKLNVLQLHLTDDQGWRVEIKKYPRLTSVGAWRAETLVGHYRDKPRRFDGKKHGGYYSQDDLRELVAFAQRRHVTIVPEIEMPGHAGAALAAYPELSCFPQEPHQVLTRWGISPDIFNPNDRTIAFLKDVLDEVIGIFPSKFIHIGGDEAIKDYWKKCPEVQERIRRLGLKNEEELQAWFTGQIDQFLAQRGRRLIGWDEILQGGLAPGATVMSWRGVKGGIAAAKAGHDVVMAPTDYTYLDFYQGPPAKEPLAIGGLLPLEKVYAFEPIPTDLSPAQHRHVLGASGQVWTEYISTPKQADYMTWPRAAALAEVVWSPAAGKDYADFLGRLQIDCKRLDALGVGYRPLAASEKGGQSAIKLTENGKSDAVIVQSAKPTAAEAFAATELADFIRRSTGVTLPIVKETDFEGGKAIYVGQTQLAAKQHVDFAKLGPEQWIIRRLDSGLMIAGGRPRGTLYGVYEFLEKFVGVRFLDADTEFVPNSATLTVPAGVATEQSPAFSRREIYMVSSRQPKVILFEVRRKMNSFAVARFSPGPERGFSVQFGSPYSNHGQSYYAKDFPTDKPEYFALTAKGARLRHGGQPCMSHPEVRKLFIERMRQYIKQDREQIVKAGLGEPFPVVYDVSPADDGEGKCLCDKCTAIARKYGSYSGVVLDFANHIAEQIVRDYPEIVVETAAYEYYVDAPPGIRPRDNVRVRIAQLGAEFNTRPKRDTLRSLEHPLNEKSRKVHEGWSKISSNLGVHDYWTAWSQPYQWPHADIRGLTQTLRLYHRCGVTDFFVEDELFGSRLHNFVDLQYYLATRLLQDPNQDEKAILREFMEPYYGPAAPAMKALLDYLEGRQEEQPGILAVIPPATRRYFDAAFFIETDAMLSEAEERVAGDPKKLANIRQERLAIDETMLHLWDKLNRTRRLPFNREEVVERLRQNYAAAYKKYGGWGAVAKKGDEERIEYLRNMPPIPAQLKDKKIIDICCPQLHLATEEIAKKVADPQAACGKAWRLDGSMAGSAGKHTESAQFGLFDNESRLLIKQTVAAENVPKDEKYHLHLVGRMKATSTMYFWAHRSWRLSQRLQMAFDSSLPDQKTYDVYVSLKLEGPGYVPGSTRVNAFLVDRLILAEVTEPDSAPTTGQVNRR